MCILTVKLLAKVARITPKSLLSLEQQAVISRQEETEQRIGLMERAMEQMERIMEEMKAENRRAMNIGEEMNQEHER